MTAPTSASSSKAAPVAGITRPAILADLRELVRYRNAIGQITMRELKARYKNTVLGLSLIHISEPTRPY